jgi:Protein of unknown function (DUF4013)
VTSVSDSYAWPFQDPGWAGKMVLQALIAIIPIIGWIALFGWLALTMDNYRAGRRELAPAGFHLERGIALFVVYFVYALVFGIPGSVISGAGSSAHDPSLSSLGSLAGFVLSVLLAFLTPAIILSTYRAGLNGGFDVGAVWKMATSNTTNTIIAGVLIWISGPIAVFGIVLCCVGLLFTIPYAVAVNAGIVTWYERMMSGPAPSGPSPALPS